MHPASLAFVTESPVAKRVTFMPLATNASVKFEATSSQGPYRRGGVRHETGERIATRITIRFYKNHQKPATWLNERPGKTMYSPHPGSCLPHNFPVHHNSL